MDHQKSQTIEHIFYNIFEPRDAFKMHISKEKCPQSVKWCNHSGTKSKLV